MSNVGLVRPAFAEELGRLDFDVNQMTPGGRLTLTTGLPVTSSDVTGATSIYYTPYLSDVIPLWNGTRWAPINFADTALALGTITNALPYDVFGYLSGAYTFASELLAWTNATTRATAITIQGGRYCKSGDKTRLYLGTFYTTSTTTTADSAGGTTSQTGGKRFLWNMYNQVSRYAAVIDTTDSWTMTSNTGYRQANNNAGNKVEFVCGLPMTISAQTRNEIAITMASGSAFAGSGGVGIDSTTTNSAQIIDNIYLQLVVAAGITGNFNIPLRSEYAGMLSAGYHAVNWLENSTNSSVTITFSGDGGMSLAVGRQAGLIAMAQM